MTEDTNKKPKKEIDAISGVETTGHEWDGLKELNNPLPRWWLWVFLITVIWSIGYWVLFPAWPVPGGATQGSLGWTSKSKLAREQAEIAARQQTYLDRFEKASFEEIMNDTELYAFANAGGASAFKDNCATCHGSGGAGAKGYPNLNDDDWLWGGTIDEIYATLKFGIRSGHEDAHIGDMSAFGRDGLLKKEQILAVTDYVMSLSGHEADAAHDKAEEGKVVYEKNCASCHMDDGKGSHEFGAPNLTDGIWLYGGSHDDIVETIYNGRKGVMPQWVTRLDDNTIRQLAVYVHQLGGGESSTPIEEPITEREDDGLREEPSEQQ